MEKSDFDTLEVFDSAIFLEIALDKEKASEARSKLYEVKNNSNRLPATTHDVLGEVNDALHDEELFDSINEREQALLNFKRAYGQNELFLLTPKPPNLIESMKEVLKIDNRVDDDRTDFYIVSKAVCEDADVIHTIGEFDWSLKDLTDVERV
ncbi:MAG: hypothetical protein BRC29_00245 [Nanohaloarchaea archaeon SW_7_43_1]|nr:MAG: hypothetical protein BRC29_00245 [Nanohaloarchaea archaeon SW_7_43_1]